MPTTIAATGRTSRHTLMLDQVMRPMLGFQRAIVLPCCLYVTAEQWNGEHPGRLLAERIDSAARELAAFATIEAANAGQSALASTRSSAPVKQG